MKKTMQNIKRELKQYLILAVVGAVSLIVLNGVSGLLPVEVELYFYISVFMLVSLCMLVTKPTPFLAFVLGMLNSICFGGDLFSVLMTVFPQTYFMMKKGYYKSVRKLIIMEALSFVYVLGAAFIFYVRLEGWYVEGRFFWREPIICVPLVFFLTELYAVYKPAFIRKLFPVEEEKKESRTVSLSTRILAVIVIIFMGLCLCALYYVFSGIENKYLLSRSEPFNNIREDMAELMTEKGISEATAGEILKKLKNDRDIVICVNEKTKEYAWTVREDSALLEDREAMETLVQNIGSGKLWIGYIPAGDRNSVKCGEKTVVIDGYSVLNENAEKVNSVFAVRNAPELRWIKGENIFLIFSVYWTMLCMILPFLFWLIDKVITRPINRMTGLVSEYAYENEENRKELERKFQDLHIQSGDEIERLYQAFGRTIQEMNSYIDSLNLKTQQIAQMQFNIISTLANVVENRDENTGSHIKRTAEYVGIIAEQMRQNEKYRDILTEKYISDMKTAAPLHDMGKIHVSDVILNKPGKLDPEEYAVMKTHTSEGRRLLKQALQDFGEFDYLLIAIDMAGSHHERWDGKGYPDGISGEEIPLCARIMAVADVFDALVSKRSYKEPMPHEKAYSIIQEGRGTQFDPDAVDAFFAAQEKIDVVLTGFEQGELR